MRRASSLASGLAACAMLLTACIPQGNPVLSTGRELLWRSSWTVSSETSAQLGLVTTPVVQGLSRPVDIKHAGDGSGRLFVVEQAGTIVTLKDGEIATPVFLDLRELVSCCGEQGLLSFAAHPDFRDNGLFFVYHTDPSGAGVVARYRVTAAGDRADPSSRTVILTVAQPGATHNGGQLQFGPDGFLYLSLGDGTLDYPWQAPNNRSQDLQELLGKVLRLDVDAGEPYRIPPDNPFYGRDDARGEIWALGLRNPWRLSFDRATGDLFITDVGQKAWEEVNVQRAQEGGRNYGWPVVEGWECRTEACDHAPYTPPALAYSHEAGCSITGGYVYRGAITRLQGLYLYGDFCSGRIWAAGQDQGGWRTTELFDTEFNISTFGEDEAGELFFADFGLGVVYKIENDTLE